MDAFLRSHAVSHPDEPFFIYNAMQVTHSPLLAPEGMLGHPACSLISDSDRKTFCAMVVALFFFPFLFPFAHAFL